MSKYFDAEGNEVEAFTPEELEAQKQAAIAEAQKNNPELTKLQAELADKNKELEGFKNKDLNFSNLKEVKEAAEKRAAELEAKINEVQNGTVNSMKNEIFDQLSNGDKDLKAKIEAEFNTFRGEPKTKEEIIAQAQKALAIVKPPVVPGAFDAFNAANGGRNKVVNNPGQKFEPTPELQNIGSKMGVSKEDWEKFGGQVK